MPGDSSSSSVGARMPGANPLAASLGHLPRLAPRRQGGDERDGQRDRPRPERGGDEQTDARDDDEGGDGLGGRQPRDEPPRPRRRIDRVGAPPPRALRTREPNSHGPTAPMSAGTSVRHTRVTTSAATARPGPNTRKKCSFPASRDSAPAMTSMPAANTSGATRAVAHRAASVRVAPCAQPPSRLGHEEDRVVRDEPEQQDDEHRLDLVRHAVARLLAHPAERADRDDVAEAGGREGHERRADGAEVHGDDDEDRQDRRRLHPRQRLVDLVPLRQPGRARARDAPRRAGRRRRQRRDVGARRARALVEVQVRREEQVGDDRRLALAPTAPRAAARRAAARRRGRRASGSPRRPRAAAPRRRRARAHAGCARPRPCRSRPTIRTAAAPAAASGRPARRRGRCR